MGLLYQAVNVRAPQYRTKDSDGSSPMGYTSQILFTVTAVALTHEMPERFWGKYVRIRATVETDFVFSDNPTQGIDTAVVATDAGTVSQNLGGKLDANQARECRIPSAPPDGKIYFARRAGGAGNVLIELASD